MAFMNDDGQRAQLCWCHALIPSSQQAVPQAAWHVAHPVPPATAIMPHGQSPIMSLTSLLSSCCPTTDGPTRCSAVSYFRRGFSPDEVKGSYHHCHSQDASESTEKH